MSDVRVCKNPECGKDLSGRRRDCEVCSFACHLSLRRAGRLAARLAEPPKPNCPGCGGEVPGMKPGKIYCQDACQRRHYELARRGSGASARRMGPIADTDGDLSRLTDPQAARLYESLRARVESGELRRDDRRWIDAKDEMEVRCEERWIIACGKFIYSWDRIEKTFRRRLAGPGRRPKAPPKDEDRRVHKTPRIDFSLAS